MRVVVLTYHSNNVAGLDYGNNDHVALRHDLRLIAELGLPIVSMRAAVEAVLGEPPGLPAAAVALSCDDGSAFDWHELPHPTFGALPGFRNVLAAGRRESGLDIPLTSFVIASPGAREELDSRCLVGRGWWDDAWWTDAWAAGIDVQNHSWDHNHDCLTATAVPSCAAGRFDGICSWDAADAEIRRASDYIDSRCGVGHSRLFAYPYGHCSEYLADEYLPRHANEHRLRAAFTTTPEPLSSGVDRWRMGRYVCGHHWRSPDELRELLCSELRPAATISIPA